MDAHAARAILADLRDHLGEIVGGFLRFVAHPITQREIISKLETEYS